MELCEYSTQKERVNHRLISVKQSHKYYEIDEFISQDLLYIAYKNNLIENFLPQTILYRSIFLDNHDIPIYLMYWGDIGDGEITFALPPYIIFIYVGGMDFMIIHNYPKYTTYLITIDYINIKYTNNLLYLRLHIGKYEVLSYISQYLIALTIYGYDIFNKCPRYLVYLHTRYACRETMYNIPKSLLTITSKYKNEY
jgi:hypothetical protein